MVVAMAARCHTWDENLVFALFGRGAVGDVCLWYNLALRTKI